MSELETLAIFAGCMYTAVFMLVVFSFRGVKNGGNQ